MSKEKSPAFQFYPSDWLSDINITLMKPEEEGAYIRLLAYAWNNDDCSLNDDDDQLAEISRLKERWYGESAKNIRRCFIKDGDKIFSERLRKEKRKQKKWQKKSSEAGKKSGQVRRSKRLMTTKVGSDLVEPKANSSIPSSSPSSSSSNTPTSPVEDRDFNDVNFEVSAEGKKTKDPVAKRARLAKMFNRANPEAWDRTEHTLFNQSVLEDDDFDIVEEFYLSKSLPDGVKKRQSIGALLENWNSEVGKARTWYQTKGGKKWKNARALCTKCSDTGILGEDAMKLPCDCRKGLTELDRQYPHGDPTEIWLNERQAALKAAERGTK